MSKQSEFAVLLGMNPLFAGLGADSIGKIAALCHTLHLATGEILFQKGERGDALFGIRRGQIRIETGSAAGKRLTMNVLGAGDLFGEIAVLDGQPRTAEATAAEPSELFVVRRSDFLEFLKSEPQAAIKLISLLCQRIRWTSDRLEESLLLSLPVRLARRLSTLAADFGSDVCISQEQLGIYVGATRESVNRQLQQWRRQGIIEVHRGRISLLDADRLMAETRQG